jgi:acyl carrier protein
VFVLSLSPNELPMTGTGKVDRKALGDLALALPPAAAVAAGPADATEAQLEALWREALNWTGELDRARRFDDSGGDSLRVVSLLMGVEQQFGRRVSLSAFYESPTFERLAALVAQASIADRPQALSFWPLGDELHRGMLYHLESWPGARATEDRLLLLLNEDGDLPPLFGIFNAGHEFVDLGRVLGPRQPLYGFRSAYEVGRREEDDIQALALRYVRDILEVCPEGPFFLLGQCQGGRIALAIAEHLRRRGRRLPLLILAEWEPERTFYPDPVVLLYGRDSVLNPRISTPGAKPEWGRFFLSFEEDEVEGEYGQLYNDLNIASLSGRIAHHCEAALNEAPRPFDAAPPAVRISVKQDLGPLRQRRRFRLDVELTNHEDAAIEGDKWGLWLGGYWRRQDDGSMERAARLPVPAIAKGQSVKVAYRATAPTRPGAYDFFLSLFEDGRILRPGLAEAPYRTTVEVVAAGRWGRWRQFRLWAQRQITSLENT